MPRSFPSSFHEITHLIPTVTSSGGCCHCHCGPDKEMDLVREKGAPAGAAGTRPGWQVRAMDGNFFCRERRLRPGRRHAPAFTTAGRRRGVHRQGAGGLPWPSDRSLVLAMPLTSQEARRGEAFGLGVGAVLTFQKALSVG